MQCIISEKQSNQNNINLSHDVASGSDITLCNKIDKPLVVNRFSRSVMTGVNYYLGTCEHDGFHAW